MPRSSSFGRLTAFVPTRFHLVRLAALGLFMGSACTSCADLSAVAKFAATRRSVYITDNANEKAKAVQAAENYKAEQPDMLAAQKVLVDYIAALAAISTDSTISRDSSVAATQAGLVKIGMSATQATAGVGLATKTVDALTARYRSNKAGKVIHDANPLLQDYLKGLEEIAGVDYPLVLGLEETAARHYYDGLLHDYGDKEPLAAVMIRLQMQQDLAGIEKKRQAAAAYNKILTDIGEGHQKLYDAGENMSKKALGGIVEPYVEDIATQSAKVAKAF
jgi:hypothetical protein